MIYWNNEALGESWRGPGIPRPGVGLRAHGSRTAEFILLACHQWKSLIREGHSFEKAYL